MRTVIKSLDRNQVTLTCQDPITGKTVVTSYWAPSQGGYVRDVTDKPGTLGSQVCDGLHYLGNTLRWAGGNDPLVDMIRYEHQVAMRQNRRNSAKG